MSAKYFDNSWHSSSPGESIALTVRLVLCWTAVAVRIGGKASRDKSIKRVFGWDDVFIVAALLIGSAGPITTLWSKPSAPFVPHH
jgi:hypothetical protein